METISVKDLRFALRAIDEIYGLTDKDIQITGNKNSFRLIFFFMQRKITVDITIMHRQICFTITIICINT